MKKIPKQKLVKIYIGQRGNGKNLYFREMLLFYLKQRYKEYKRFMKNARFRFRDLFLIKYLIDIDNFGVYYAKKNS